MFANPAEFFNSLLVFADRTDSIAAVLLGSP